MFEIELVKTNRTDVYPAISPSRPELSQEGRTVLITGGSAGIGLAIARAFGQASAARIIIASRRHDAVEEATSKLTAEFQAAGFKTVVEGRVCDVSNLESTEALWSGLQKDGIVIDVLVLNAAVPTNPGSLLDRKLDAIWNEFTINVRSALDFMQRFKAQKEPGASSQKFLVYLSTLLIGGWMAAHASAQPAYPLTKTAATLAVQQVANSTDPKELQISLYHPGAILTTAARSAGFDENSFPWDKEELPGQFAVWAASKEAESLHGRLVSATWDVDEMTADKFRHRIEEDAHFLRVGISGFSA